MALRFRQERQFRESLARIIYDTFKQHLPVSNHALDSCCIEQISVVLEVTDESIWTIIKYRG